MSGKTHRLRAYSLTPDTLLYTDDGRLLIVELRRYDDDTRTVTVYFTTGEELQFGYDDIVRMNFPE